MTRYRFALVIPVAVAFVLSLSTPLRAHEHSGSDTTARITGFSGLSWGVSEQTVIDRFGHPRFETLVGEIPDLELAARSNWSQGGKRMIYLNHPVYDTAVTTTFYVHPFEGLFKGTARFDPPAPDRCRETYRRVKHRVQRQFPDIKPRESGEDPPEFRTFCSAVRGGDAFRVADWRDPGSLAFVRVSLKRNNGSVWLSFFSPTWVEHLKTLRRFHVLHILHRQGRSLDAFQNRHQNE